MYIFSIISDWILILILCYSCIYELIKNKKCKHEYQIINKITLRNPYNQEKLNCTAYACNKCNHVKIDDFEEVI